MTFNAVDGAVVPFNDARAGGGGAVEFEEVIVVLERIVTFPPAKAVATFVAPCVKVTVLRTVVGGREVVCVTVLPWTVVVIVVTVPGWVSSMIITCTEDEDELEEEEEELPAAPT